MERSAGAEFSDNVRPIREFRRVFGDNVRSRLEDSVKPYTEKPKEAVNSVENALCVFLVSEAGDLMTRLGQAAGKKFADVITGKLP